MHACMHAWCKNIFRVSRVFRLYLGYIGYSEAMKGNSSATCAVGSHTCLTYRWIACWFMNVDQGGMDSLQPGCEADMP